MCIVPLFLLPNVQLQIKLPKARPSFYLMNKTADMKTNFKFLDDYLMVKRVQPNPLILSAHERAQAEEALARYNMTRVDFYIFGRVKIPVYTHCSVGPPPQTPAVQHD